LVERTLAASGRNSVQISGGEPLLRPDLFEILEALKKPGRAISLVTDGGLADAGVVQKLKALGVAPVQPTLLAARRQVHDHLKGCPSFDAAVGAISRLTKADVPVSVSFVCTALNYLHFKEVVELCFAMGVRTIAFSRFCTAGVGAARCTELAPDAGMIRSCLDIAEMAVERLRMRIVVAISLPLCVPEPRLGPEGGAHVGPRRAEDGVPEDQEVHSRPRPGAQEHRYPMLKFGRCAAGGEAPGYTVDPWGRLRACSVSPVVLGDLKAESFEAVVARARSGYFREVNALPAACVGCPAAARCGGGCRESARATYGNLDRPDPLVPTTPEPLTP